MHKRNPSIFDTLRIAENIQISGIFKGYSSYSYMYIHNSTYREVSSSRGLPIRLQYFVTTIFIGTIQCRGISRIQLR